MQKKYLVRLTDAEREMLNRLVKTRRVSAQKVRRAQILLKADADGPNWADVEIAKAFDCSIRTLEYLRERLVTEGFEIALNGQPKSRIRGKALDGEQEAKIIALRLGEPPRGFANWSLRLLAEQAVALEIIDSVSHETLRGMLKKTISRRRRSSIGSSPRKPTPSSPRAWRKCWTSMLAPTIPGIPCCAWTSSRCSC